MVRRRKDLIFEESLFNNMDDYIIFKARLLDMAYGSFNFENVPKNVYMRYVIERLITKGQVLAFKDDILDKFFLYDFTTAGKLNEYNVPTLRQVHLANIGANYTLNEENSVILRANVSGTNIYHVIEFFARNIYLLNRTIQINVNAQKTPVALTCSENERLTYENLLKQYSGNVPVIFGSKDLDLSQLKSINLNAPFVSTEIYTLLANYWNEFLTFFGIPNVSLNKKERLISDEVARSMGGVMVARQNFENQIQSDIEDINDMFGLDIKFTWGVKPENEEEKTLKVMYNEDSSDDEPQEKEENTEGGESEE